MSKKFNFTELAEQAQKEIDKDKLDARASYVALEQCFNTINLNNMEELESLKMHIKAVMKELEKIGKYGKEEKGGRPSNPTGNC